MESSVAPLEDKPPRAARPSAPPPAPCAHRAHAPLTCPAPSRQRATPRPLQIGGALCAALGLLSLPTAASALGGAQLHLHLEAGYASLSEADQPRLHGGYTALRAGSALNDFWSLHGTYTLGHYADQSALLTEHQLSADLRYLLDVFEYVPWVSLSPVAAYHALDHSGAHWALGGRVGLGLDRLLNEHWAIGLSAHTQYLWTTDQPRWGLGVGLHLGYRLALGDPYAP